MSTVIQNLKQNYPKTLKSHPFSTFSASPLSIILVFVSCAAAICHAFILLKEALLSSLSLLIYSAFCLDQCCSEMVYSSLLPIYLCCYKELASEYKSTIYLSYNSAEMALMYVWLCICELSHIHINISTSTFYVGIRIYICEYIKYKCIGMYTHIFVCIFICVCISSLFFSLIFCA